MLFTICIPTYNRGALIPETIESVLRQSNQDFEIIVVDDGSTDNTEEVIKGYADSRIEYYYKDNGGKHTALNIGINKAKGDLFLVLDSDDSLVPDCLEFMAAKWKQIGAFREDLCGIMGRCVENGRTIGMLFPNEGVEMSYVEFHYGKNGGRYKDCCECIRTDILKQFSWPEDKRTHFVPEALVMDQIGLKYKMICYNKALKNIRYLEDGITKNRNSYRLKNYIGYLYDSVSKIDQIIPASDEVTSRFRLIIWWKYWNLVKLDIDNCGPRVSRVTVFGWYVKMLVPVINLLKKV